jgi:hypothetical protein
MSLLSCIRLSLSLYSLPPLLGVNHRYARMCGCHHPMKSILFDLPTTFLFIRQRYGGYLYEEERLPITGSISSARVPIFVEIICVILASLFTIVQKGSKGVEGLEANQRNRKVFLLGNHWHLAG